MREQEQENTEGEEAEARNCIDVGRKDEDNTPTTNTKTLSITTGHTYTCYANRTRPLCIFYEF